MNTGIKFKCTIFKWLGYSLRRMFRLFYFASKCEQVNSLCFCKKSYCAKKEMRIK